MRELNSTNLQLTIYKKNHCRRGKTARQGEEAEEEKLTARRRSTVRERPFVREQGQQEALIG